VDADGNVHLLYQTGPFHHLHGKGAVLTDELLDALPLEADQPFLVADSQGALHVAYEVLPPLSGSRRNQIHYATNRGGTWTDEIVGVDLVLGDLQLDSNDNPVLAGALHEPKRKPDGPPALWVVPRDQSGWTVQELASLQQGVSNVHLFLQSDDSPLVYWSEVYRTLATNGTFETDALVPIEEQASIPAVGSDYVRLPSGDVAWVTDPRGAVFDPGRVELSFDPMDGGTAHVLFDGTSSRYAPQPTQPAIAVGPGGKLYVAHREPHGLFLETQVGQVFQAEKLISQAPTLFDLAVDGTGEPHVFYLQGSDALEEWELRHIHRGVCPP
jgi:hypothetical protein